MAARTDPSGAQRAIAGAGSPTPRRDRLKQLRAFCEAVRRSGASPSATPECTSEVRTDTGREWLKWLRAFELDEPPRSFGVFARTDLRHTAASQAVMAGEGLALVGRLLGHSRYRTTAGYAHLANSRFVEAAEKVGAVIARAMARAGPLPSTGMRTGSSP